MILNVGCGNDDFGEIRIDLIRGSANLIADARALPFRNQSFSEVYCISVLEHIDDWRGALAEIQRVCSWKLIIEVPVRSDIRFTDVYRLLIPTPHNIRLIMALPKRSREHLWQFTPKGLVAEIKGDFVFQIYKKISWYAGAISRCWRLEALRKT